MYKTMTAPTEPFMTCYVLGSTSFTCIFSAGKCRYPSEYNFEFLCVDIKKNNLIMLHFPHNFFVEREYSDTRFSKN